MRHVCRKTSTTDGHEVRRTGMFFGPWARFMPPLRGSGCSLGVLGCYRHAGPTGLRIYHRIMGFAARKTLQVSKNRTASTYCQTERRRCGMSVEKPAQEAVMRSVGSACSSDRGHASCRPYGAPDVVSGVVECYRHAGPTGLRTHYQTWDVWRTEKAGGVDCTRSESTIRQSAVGAACL
mgnify:CR=1 FL=1